MSTTTFYPDPHPETSSVDGQIRRQGINEIWANKYNGVGNASDDSDVSLLVWIQTTNTPSIHRTWRLSLIVFDTSALPDTDTISSGSFEFVCWIIDPGGAAFGQKLVLTPGVTASNTAIVNSDYQSNIKTSTRWNTTDLAWASVNDDDTTYNSMALNATGVAGISKTGVTKFCWTLDLFADNNEPVWQAGIFDNLRIRSADQPGTSQDVKLVVVHTAVAAGSRRRKYVQGVAHA